MSPLMPALGTLLAAPILGGRLAVLQRAASADRCL
jgi:hypothetical protein